ncbi:hypothetical protein LWI29_006354 [Acer saccharum]|uniref:Integrase zinc-binding domain-containing protein n=1 Tax=Acer saccharum TaxID=4024 RepID=A0AA39RH08_ACESA|nr:hypothetical protein LWI29_006354 [Acer saccharum]
MNGTYEARDQRMSAYLTKAKQLQSTFDEFTIEQILRSENARADALANLGSTTTNGSKSIPIMHLMSPTIQEAEVLAPIDHGRNWMEPIFNYLQVDIPPDDRTEARRIKAKATKFCILYGKLYKKSFTGPYLRCVTNREAYDVLKSLHYEECRNHSGARSLSNRAITAGYYRPTMRTDSQNHVKSCDKCQRFTLVSHLPPEKNEWAEKLPEILWSYRTTPRRSTGETPFSLVYSLEAVIPIETWLATARSENPNEEQNSLELNFELDHLDECRDRAALRIQAYQQQVA